MHEEHGADGHVGRERRVLLWVSRAARRLEQAGRERSWAVASALDENWRQLNTRPYRYQAPTP